MELLLAVFGAGTGGALVAIGTAANARLRQSLRSAIAAALINFTVGFLSSAALIAVSRMSLPAIAQFATVPGWAWGGGVLGAVFVTLSTLVVPQLGLTTSTLAVVCSQMVMALVIDQLGWLGNSPQPISLARVVAIACLILAVALTQLDRAARPLPTRE